MSERRHKKLKIEHKTVLKEHIQSHDSQRMTTRSRSLINKSEKETSTASSKMVATTSHMKPNDKDMLLSCQLSPVGRKNKSLKSVRLCDQYKTKPFQIEPTGEHVLKDVIDETSPQTDQNSLLGLTESAPPRQILKFLQGDHSFSQYELDNSLMSACKRGHKFFVQNLVSLGANVLYKDTNGYTPLMVCAKNGFLDIARFLLNRKADANTVNNAGDTALTLSIHSSGSIDMVKMLLEQQNIDIHHQNHKGYTAFMKAVKVMDIDTAIFLLQHVRKQVSSTLFLYEPCYRKCVINENIRTLMRKSRTIAKKRGLGNVMNYLSIQSRLESPLIQAFDLCDVASFKILLDCQFPTSKRNWSLQDVLNKIFQKNVKAFQVKEILMITSLLERLTDMSGFNGHHHVTVAVEAGNVGLVELLCKHGALKPYYYHDDDPLCAAASNGRCDLIKLLLSYKTDAKQSSFCLSPLDCALKHGHIDSAKLLIEHGAVLQIESALVSAVKSQSIKYMNFLQQNYRHEIVSFFQGNKTCKFDILISAAKYGSLDIIEQILDAGADINQPNFSGKTALVESKDGKVAKFLIQRGADVHQIIKDDEKWPNTPLIHVLKSRYSYDSSVVDIIRVLLQNGAPINGKEKNGRTALMFAASKEGSETLLQILLDHGANLCDKDNDGNTALILAARGCCSKNVLFLLQFSNKALLNAQNNQGATALKCCLPRNDLLKELLNAGADVNIQDAKGNTVLLLLLKDSMNHATTLRNLIAAGGDVNCHNSDGFSPLMLASRNRWAEAILILLDAGANVNDENKNDKRKTALSYLMDIIYFTEDTMKCMETLLDWGASTSNVDSRVLAKVITSRFTDVIPKLIRCGLGPAEIKSKILSREIPTVSPLCVALLDDNVTMASYFINNLFLTKSDVSSSLMCNNALRDYLEISKHTECLDLLDKFCSRPLSLFKLAFVAVTSAVGPSPGREDRVNLLPLPQVIKNRLLFKSEEIAWTNDPSLQSPKVCVNTYFNEFYLVERTDENSDSENEWLSSDYDSYF